MDIGAAHVDAVEHLSRRDGRLKTARALAHVGVQPQRQVELAAAQHVHAGHNGRAAREVQLQGRHLEIARDERVHKLSERELVDEEAAAERAVAHAGNCGHRVPAHIRIDEVCAAAQRVVQLGGEVHGMFSDQTAARALVPHLSGAFLSVAARAGAARSAPERGGRCRGKWQSANAGAATARVDWNWDSVYSLGGLGPQI